MMQRDVPGQETPSASALRIGEASVPGTGGVIGMTLCPGKKGPSTRSGVRWDRDLDADLERIRRWGAEVIVTLMERHELDALQVGHMGEAVFATGLRWFHLPIVDGQAPDGSFEVGWNESGPHVRAILADGGRVLLHCRGGLGRTGVVAARLLMEFGVPVEDAMRTVHEARRGTIETSEQERYLRDLARVTGDVAAAAVAPRGDSEHFAGCLLGGAVGDALGAPLRWLSTQDGVGPYREREGEDGADEQTGLLQVPELYSHRAPGNTCLSALRSGKMGTVAEHINSSKGCGGVMRVAPVALFVRCERDSEEDGGEDSDCAAFRIGCDLAAITHGHASGYLSAGALALLLSRILAGDSLQAALRRVGRDFPRGVLLAVNHSGDSDSTGAITGNILGAHHGQHLGCSTGS